MAERIRPTFSRTMLVIITALLTVLVDQCISGATCRFASTSDSQGPCIFPCRCTNGCNTITGECINGGQCQDGPPSGYRWSGPACQTGNVGYKKTAHQSGEKLNKWSIE
ncbi:hypothetical protein LSAT2_018912 [Lamellibrachia satsuma]|nr:hypothetical protein LSAT2_018912 [Lamellibrachia satsuma]